MDDSNKMLSDNNESETESDTSETTNESINSSQNNEEHEENEENDNNDTDDNDIDDTDTNDNETNAETDGNISHISNDELVELVEFHESEANDEMNNDNECIYKNIKKNKLEESDDDIENENEFFEDDNKIFNEIVKNEDRKTRPVLTKYERVRLISERAKQISLGSIPLIDVPDNMTDPIDIAKLEIQQKKSIMIIERQLPNGKREHWRLNELLLGN